jgi:hypothetical protein
MIRISGSLHDVVQPLNTDSDERLFASVEEMVGARDLDGEGAPAVSGQRYPPPDRAAATPSCGRFFA